MGCENRGHSLVSLEEGHGPDALDPYSRSAPDFLRLWAYKNLLAVVYDKEMRFLNKPIGNLCNLSQFPRKFSLIFAKLKNLLTKNINYGPVFNCRQVPPLPIIPKMTERIYMIRLHFSQKIIIIIINSHIIFCKITNLCLHPVIQKVCVSQI